MRRLLPVLLALLLVAGCGRVPPGDTNTGGTIPAAISPPPGDAAPSGQTPVPPTATSTSAEQQPPAAHPAPPRAEVQGDTIRLAGFAGGDVQAVSWSPSGRQAALWIGKGGPHGTEPVSTWLLDLRTDTPRLQELVGVKPIAPPRFWSEGEILWQQQDGVGSRLILRQVASGQDRELIRFPARVWFGSRSSYGSTIRSGAATFPYVRLADEPRWPSMDADSPVGEVWIGRLGANEAVKVWERGWLVGQVTDGRTLAIQSELDHGPLAAIAPDGKVTLLAKDAYSPQVSPDGSQVLWFTTDAEAAPAAYASPLVNRLWRWNGSAPPTALELGGLYVGQGLFSPDGRQVVVSLGEQDWMRPSRLAVIENGKLRTIYAADVHLSIVDFDGREIAYVQAVGAGEKTGAPPSYPRIDLTGRALAGRLDPFVSGFSEWYREGDSSGLILHWRGSTVRRKLASPFCFPHGSYVAQSDPYIACWERDGITLRPLALVAP